ncbi:hypothetical protein A9Q98_06680 [Thalassotalea sp. 42_200_T64]|nr:hypothetical protein A9Q98_06680 [Thalassotalea sp. 42_200_T64]
MAVNNNKSFNKTIIFSLFAASISLFLPHPLNAQQSVASQELNEQSFVDDKKATYGPIEKSDTLWKIAVAHRPDSTVSNYQVMKALFHANPNAFLREDINTMIVGQFLRIPAIAEIRQIAPYVYASNNAVESKLVVNTASSTLITALNASSDAHPETVTPQPLSKPEQAKVAAATDTVEVELVNQDLNAETATENRQQLAAENSELKESLTAVDEQLSYLQYEVAKATEMQAQMDDKLAQQNALLREAKLREQKLFAQQRKFSEQQQGFFNNPLTYWSINGVLAVLVLVLFVLVSRRRKIEQQSLHANDKEVSDEPQTKFESEQLEKVIQTTGDKPLKLNREVNKTTQPTLTNTTEDKEHEPVALATELKVSAKSETKAESALELSAEGEQEVKPLSDEDLLAKLLPANSVSNDNLAQNEDEIAIQANEDDLDIDQIIDGMLDEASKPAKLRSARVPPDELVVPTEDFEDKEWLESNKQVPEINDYDDVEFDKLLAEISAESQHIKMPSNVTQLRRPEIKETVKSVISVKQNENFISVDKLIDESNAAEELADDVYAEHEIDVGLDEFPEFTSQVNHVNVDDDKNGINAKLDLAQVYIEIGDLDNAAVILKNVINLGDSTQQQQAQQLLYSIG